MLDLAAARLALCARLLRCPDCGERLRPWGRARPRRIREGDEAVELTPDRARCTGCAATHVLLPATVVPRSGYGARTVAAALLAAADGAGHRTIAAELAVPAGTVRDWCRRARRGADAISARAARTAQLLGAALRPLDGWTVPPLAEALATVAAAASALADALEAAARPRPFPAASGVDYLHELATAHLHDLAHRLRLALVGTVGATALQLLTVVTDGLLPAPAR
ncbi:DUF6431 domain-containing protein [Kitasatospora sp. NPDC093102]|uniref:DUF6431 domain-containing protein n=1 Tax=Kitasatospora sp. NPDC093102 TaxID=3155069 RepID=UPI00343822DF